PYNKTSGSTSFDTTFNNTGAVNVATGATLALNVGFAFNSGTLTATLPSFPTRRSSDLVGGTTALAGTGAFQLTANTLTFNASTRARNSARLDGTQLGTGALSFGNYTLSGGTSSMNSLTLTSSGSGWSGGTMNGSGTTTV